MSGEPDRGSHSTDVDSRVGATPRKCSGERVWPNHPGYFSGWCGGSSPASLSGTHFNCMTCLVTLNKFQGSFGLKSTTSALHQWFFWPCPVALTTTQFEDRLDFNAVLRNKKLSWVVALSCVDEKRRRCRHWAFLRSLLRLARMPSISTKPSKVIQPSSLSLFLSDPCSAPFPPF